MKPLHLAVVAALALAAAGGLHHWRGSRAPAVIVPQDASAPVPAPSAQPPVPLPPLDQSDSFIREQAQALSPRLAAMLSSESLVRRIAAAVDIIANGDSPRESLVFFKPRGKFAVMAKQGQMVIDPRCYERYDTFADVIDSLDVATVARLRRQLAPLLDAAYGELGQGAFEPRIAGAISHLLAVPVVADDVRLRRKVITYRMVDSRLENLTAAQKHLRRMGPKNVAKIQNKLRLLAQALDVPLTP